MELVAIKWAYSWIPHAAFTKILQVQFHLATNFSFKTDIEKLARFDSLNFKEKKRISNKFINLCRKVGATQAEANKLLKLISYESISEEELWIKLQRRCTESFSLGSKVDSILCVLLENALIGENNGRQSVEKIWKK